MGEEATILLLGVFSGNTFRELNYDPKVASFSGCWEEDIVNEHHGTMRNVIGRVSWKAHKVDQIYFSLDNLDLQNISGDSFQQSYTMNELLLIITTPEYLNKTTFYLDNQVVEKEKIVDSFIFHEYWNQAL